MKEDSKMAVAAVSVPVPVATDGGWGWVVLAGAFVAYFLADGWSYSFGVLFPSLLENFEEGKGKTSLIAALLYGVPMLLSPVVCALTTCYGCRGITIVGGVLTAVSILLSAFANSISLLCASIGLLMGIGLVMTYIPSLFIVTFYFEKKRGLATGLAMTGSGLGAILFPPFMEWLCGLYSWRGFMMITSALCLHIIVAGLLFRAPPMSKPQHDEDDSLLLPPTRNKLPNAILMPRRHGQAQPLKASQSCMELDRSGVVAHSRFISASELSLGSPCRFSGAVAIEIDTFDDVPKSTSYPEFFAGVETEPEPREVFQKDVLEHEKKPSAWQRFWAELRMILVTMVDKSLLTNGGFLLFVAANFILYLWIGVPYIFLIDRAQELEIASPSNLVLLSSIIGVGRTVGQIVMGHIGDYPGVNCNVLYGASIAVIGVDTVLVPFCTTYARLCVYATVYGLFVSVTYAIQMMCVVEIVGIERATSGFGFMQLLQGIATILGTPLAGQNRVTSLPTAYLNIPLINYHH